MWIYYPSVVLQATADSEDPCKAETGHWQCCHHRQRGGSCDQEVNSAAAPTCLSFCGLALSTSPMGKCPSTVASEPLDGTSGTCSSALRQGQGKRKGLDGGRCSYRSLIAQSSFLGTVS